MKGLYKKARARRAQELHRHRQPLRAARARRDPHRHDRRRARAGRRADRRHAAARWASCTRERSTSVCAALAGEAGRLLQDACEALGAALGEAGDRLANDLLLASARRAAARRRPAVGGKQDTRARSQQDRVWIIDPLDGTREYGEARADWAVHVGPRDRRRADRRRGRAAGARRRAALRSTRRSSPTRSRRSRLACVVSRTRPAAEAEQLAVSARRRAVPMGSAGAKAMAVVRGEADIYLHSRRPVRMGQLRAGRGRRCRRAALLAHRRLTAGLQPTRSVPARPADLPPRARRAGPRGGVQVCVMRSVCVNRSRRDWITAGGRHTDLGCHTESVRSCACPWRLGHVMSPVVANGRG